MFNKRIDDCNCDRPRDTLLLFFQMYLSTVTVKMNVLSIQEKKVKARSTKHQVHFGIIALCFFLKVPLFDLQSAIVTFHGHSHYLANIVFFQA